MESEKISCGDISIVSDGSPTNLDKEGTQKSLLYFTPVYRN